MMFECSRPALAAVLALGLSACGQAENKAADEAAPAPAPAAAAAPAASSLPSVDAESARQFATGEDTFEALTFDRTGATTVKGLVRGDAAPVYAVPVAAGQTLTVTFVPANTNLYINVSDAADHSGAALHRGEVDGQTATLKAERDMTFVITPYQPRAMARRNETGEFSLTVARD